MRFLTASEFLTLWEDGLDWLPFQRASALLERAYPECTGDEVRALSVGRRDTLLFPLYQSEFGSQLQAVSTCPTCRISVEIAVELDQLKQAQPDEERIIFAADDIQAKALVNSQGQEFSVRAPNGFDLEAAAGLGPEAAALEILGRCVKPTNGDAKMAAEMFSPELIDKVSGTMAMLDPQADCVLELVCANCESSWSERLDIVAFFWNELDVWARRTLREIHSLAQAYGWSEAEILSLSSHRRQLYLAMVNS